MREEALLSYLGKGREEGLYHPLPYHCLDVAVGGVLLLK